MNSFIPQRVAVLGPGLLGGSILLALKARYPEVRLSAWARRDAAVEPIRAQGLAHIASSKLDEVVEGVDFVILCTPVETMVELARQLATFPLAPGCIITDVGSVKGSIVTAIEEVLAPTNFHYIGSHPMAGSEKAGLEAARADLFENQTCIVTPSNASDAHALEQVQQFWLALGCKLMMLDVQAHDYAVARISHLPRLAASIVAQAALGERPECVQAIGNGFRDTTRVASGDPTLWTGIVMQNYEEVIKAVQSASTAFQDLLEILQSKDEERLRQFLLQAKQLRDLVSSH